jgi:hypothetical protein
VHSFENQLALGGEPKPTRPQLIGQGRGDHAPDTIPRCRKLEW